METCNINSGSDSSVAQASVSESKRKADEQSHDQTTKKCKSWHKAGLSKKQRRAKLKAMCHERHKNQKKVPLHMLYGNRGLFDDDQQHFAEAEYYFEKGLRKVRPYFFDYNTFCKERWLGKTLREIYAKEFRAVPPQYYEFMMKNDQVLVNLKPVKSFDVKLKANDMLTSRIHRHEAPVKDRAIEIIDENAKFLVVNKPPSVPMHACGRYRYNSLIYILAKVHGYAHLFSCHRLDRLTSGIVILAKTKDAASTVSTQIRDRKVAKEYLSKVVGEFPSRTDCRQPISKFNAKHGYVVAQEVDGVTPKEAVTEFELVSSDGGTSVVLCRPKTGRTHQIRAHLQYLGHPIVNDPIYNNPAWGPERFQHGPITKPLNAIVTELEKRFTEHVDVAYSSMDDQGESDSASALSTASPVTTVSTEATGIASTSSPPPSSPSRESRSHDPSPLDCPELSNEGSSVAKTLSAGSGRASCDRPVGETPACGANGRGFDSGPVEPISSESVDETSVVVSKQEPGRDFCGGENADTRQTDPSGSEIAEQCAESDPYFAPNCPECRNPLPDPPEEEMMMFLHAYRYKGDGFNFTSPLPDWAAHYDKNKITNGGN